MVSAAHVAEASAACRGQEVTESASCQERSVVETLRRAGSPSFWCAVATSDNRSDEDVPSTTRAAVQLVSRSSATRRDNAAL